MDLRTDSPKTFEGSAMELMGYSMAKKAAENVYKQSGVTPKDVQVCEMHDCFSANELCTYEAIGLCPEGGAGPAIDNNEFTYGGRIVVNPSGGLISKGHPLGATGLAQCAELCWQLRGMSQKRQVADVKHALQHNLGLGGCCVVTMYGRNKPDAPGFSRPD